MEERRGVLLLATGVTGLLLGVGGALWESFQMAVIAGALALVGGVSAWRLVGLLREARREIRALTGEVNRQRRAREMAEAQRDRIRVQGVARMAVREAPTGDLLLDPATGLYSEDYFMVALDGRVTTAKRTIRPVTCALVDTAVKCEDGFGPADALVVSEVIRAALDQRHTAARLAGGEFGIIMDDTDTETAVIEVRRLREEIASRIPGATVWGGVACYPAHASNSDDLVRAAEKALICAREWRNGKIEAATTAEEY
ncbi:MAG: hypothetical protein KatS3mg008_1255 [Acidimicrobiales bacterium]|nr:MAG: hypothetical protein KatS3mg008_1255 [Acidimicrobiales bacterium]